MLYLLRFDLSFAIESFCLLFIGKFAYKYCSSLKEILLYKASTNVGSIQRKLISHQSGFILIKMNEAKLKF